MKIKLTLAILSTLCLFIPVKVMAAKNLTFTWTDTSNNEDGFQIENRCGTATIFTNTGSPTGPNVQTMVLVQADNLQCDYRVYAFNIAGQSGRSNTVNVSSFVVPTTPTGFAVVASLAAKEASTATGALASRAGSRGNTLAKNKALSAKTKIDNSIPLIVQAETLIGE